MLQYLRAQRFENKIAFCSASPEFRVFKFMWNNNYSQKVVHRLHCCHLAFHYLCERRRFNSVHTLGVTARTWKFKKAICKLFFLLCFLLLICLDSCHKSWKSVAMTLSSKSARLLKSDLHWHQHTLKKIKKRKT